MRVESRAILSEERQIGSVSSPASEREKRVVAFVSVLAALALTGMKLVVGLMTGSIAILAEAIHSGMDLVAALMTLLAVRVADRPADSEHQYGHGKVEHLSAFFETGLLVITCLWIVFESVSRLISGGRHLEITVWAFAVMIVSIIIDYWRSGALGRAAKKHGSDALAADALHFRTDIWSSLVVLLGLSLVVIGELTGQSQVWGKADAVSALVVAGIVLYVSGRLAKSNIDALLDRAPAVVGRDVERAVRSVSGVQEFRRLRLRRAGNRIFADLVVGVPRTTTFAKAHDLSERIERVISQIEPRADTVVHLEPVKGRHETTVDQIDYLARQQGIRAHDVRVREIDGKLDADLHVEVDPQLSLEGAHNVASRLEEAVRAANPTIRSVNTHLEAPAIQAEPRDEVTEHLHPLLDRVRHLSDSVAGEGSCHDIRIYESSEGLIDIVLHCTLPADLPIQAVHDVSTEVEKKLRDRIPQLGNVLVHIEPFPGRTANPPEKPASN